MRRFISPFFLALVYFCVLLNVGLCGLVLYFNICDYKYYRNYLILFFLFFVDFDYFSQNVIELIFLDGLTFFL